jgi:DNA-binding CsgD family transcriptional regulator
MSGWTSSNRFHVLAGARAARKPGERLGGHHRTSPDRQHDDTRPEHGERYDRAEHVLGGGVQLLGCCWPTGGCCAAPATEKRRSSACAERTTCIWRCAPFISRTEEELAACHLPGNPANKHSVLALTSRETEVAHLVGRGLSSPEIAAELFISRKAVEYHLGNIYAKCGLHGRQQLRQFVGQWRQLAAI